MHAEATVLHAAGYRKPHPLFYTEDSASARPTAGGGDAATLNVVAKAIARLEEDDGSDVTADN